MQRWNFKEPKDAWDGSNNTMVTGMHVPVQCQWTRVVRNMNDSEEQPAKRWEQAEMSGAGGSPAEHTADFWSTETF